MNTILGHHIIRRCAAIGGAALLLAGVTLPVLAVDLAWSPTRVRGTVIYLAGDKWEEVAVGQVLNTAAIRTLRSGRISIAAPGFVVELGPRAVLELGASPQHSDSQLRHYLGTITIASTGERAEGVLLQAGRLSITGIEGKVEITVSETATTFAVQSGTLTVRPPGSIVTASLHPGLYIADANGLAPISSTSVEGTVAAAQVKQQTPAGPSNGNGGVGGGNPNAGSGNNSGVGGGNPNAGSGNNSGVGGGNPNAGSGNNSGVGGGATTPPAGNDASNGQGNGPGDNSGSGPGENSSNGANGTGNGQSNGAGNGQGNGSGNGQGNGAASGKGRAPDSDQSTGTTE